MPLQIFKHRLMRFGHDIDGKATLYTAPVEMKASRIYLIKDGVVTVLKQVPVGWDYVEYINAFGKHLLRWVRVDQLAIKK